MNRMATLTGILQDAGYEVDGSTREQTLVLELDRLLSSAERDPKEAVKQVLAARRATDDARRATAEVMKSVEALEGIIEGLLDGKPLLCRLESVRGGNGEGGPCAVVRLGGQLRELAVHPGVDLEALRALMPWHYVRVHPRELVVIGYRNDPDLFEWAQGELVEFLGWVDASAGLVRVSHLGHEERIVELAPSLRSEDIQPPARLVLQRDDDRWAIALVPHQRIESRYEIPAQSITTRLEHLAGLDDLKERLVEDLILRLLRRDLLESYGVKPMRGLILESHKPGQGKTALIRAFAAYADELGRARGFDVCVYFVPPGSLKSVWHGGDAKLVREDLCGAIRARQARPRTRPLFQLIVLDEIDSLGRRGGELVSSAQNDAVTALLSEIDGLLQWETPPGQPPAEMLWIGMTNRIDLVDVAMRRPGRFDSVLRIPDATLEAAEEILALYADPRAWYLDGEVRTSVDQETIRTAFVRPALHRVYGEPVLRYSTEGRSGIDVAAGRLLSNAHYEAAANSGKKRAAARDLRGVGIPAVTLEDLVEALFGEAYAAARQMSSDHRTLARELEVPGRITRVELLGAEKPMDHRYLRVP